MKELEEKAVWYAYILERLGLPYGQKPRTQNPVLFFICLESAIISDDRLGLFSLFDSFKAKYNGNGVYETDVAEMETNYGHWLPPREANKALEELIDASLINLNKRIPDKDYSFGTKFITESSVWKDIYSPLSHKVCFTHDNTGKSFHIYKEWCEYGRKRCFCCGKIKETGSYKEKCIDCLKAEQKPKLIENPYQQAERARYMHEYNKFMAEHNNDPEAAWFAWPAVWSYGINQ